jgi:hypothetical protein
MDTCQAVSPVLPPRVLFSGNYVFRGEKNTVYVDLEPFSYNIIWSPHNSFVFKYVHIT